MARRSPAGAMLGSEAGHWTVALAAAAAAAAAAGLARWRIGPLFAALLAVGLAAQLSLGARLQSDGFYYFAYLRSLAFDGDVEFSNDYRLLGLGDKPHLFEPTPTGYAQSAWTIGPAILWAPFFAAGHATALALRDPNVTANGISYPYRQAVCVAGLVYGLLGCWLAYRFAARSFERGVAAGATAATVAGSFMLWYLVKEPSVTHAPSMALVAGFAWAWAATRAGRSTGQWMALGALAGVMTLVRWQNALFAVLPAIDAAVLLVDAWRRSDRAALRRTLAHGAAFTVAAALAFTPQMLAWNAIYGSWLAVSPLGPQIRLHDPQLADILWSSRNGLLSTSPVLYPAAIGLIALAWLRPAIGLPSLAAVALMTWFNASIQDWWGSAGFGGRRFDGTIPFFVLGLAQASVAALAFVRRRPGSVLAAAAAVLVLWNLTLVSAGHAGSLRLGESTSFGRLMAEQARAFHAWFGNPFTYPASLVFALANGVEPGAYDLLSANRFLGDPLRPYGRVDVGGDDEWLLEEGWHQAETEGTTTFRWATTAATLRVPLDRVHDLRVQIRLHAFGHAGAPPQQLTLEVNGRTQPPVPVPPGWETVELLVPRDAWRTGVNRVTLTFAWARRPADVGLGGDARPLSAAVDYLRVAVPGRS